MGVKTVELDGQKAILTLPGWARDKVWSSGGDVSNADLARAYTAGKWAFICISIRADALSKLKWEVRTDEEDPDSALGPEHPLVKLLKEVNPELNWNGLARATESDMGIYGRAYWLKVRGGRGGAPRGLMRLNPSTVTLKAGSSGIEGFNQRIGANEVFYPREDVVYFREYHPTDDLGGLSPMNLAIASVNASINAAEFTAAFFENYAMPPIVFTTEQSINSGIFDKIVSEWKRVFGGVKKQHKVGFTSHGMTPHIIGYPMKDLALKEVLDETRRDVCGVFRVPLAVAGAWETVNRATSQEQMKALFENAIEPRTEYYSGVLEAELFPEFDRNLFMAWRFDKLPVMAEDKKEEAERHAIMVRAGIEDPEAAATALEVEPAVPGIVPAQLQNADPSTTPTGLDRELMQWQRFATNRAKRGEKVDQVFKCEHVPVTLQKSIIGQLETAKDVRDVKEIFTAAGRWRGYP